MENDRVNAAAPSSSSSSTSSKNNDTTSTIMNTGRSRSQSQSRYTYQQQQHNIAPTAGASPPSTSISTSTTGSRDQAAMTVNNGGGASSSASRYSTTAAATGTGGASTGNTASSSSSSDRRVLSSYQTAAHEPVYMAARTSPIGPPPRGGLPALPPPPTQGARNVVNANSSHAAAGTATPGSSATAGNVRPVTAVYQPNGVQEGASGHGPFTGSSSNSSNHHQTRNSHMYPREGGAASSSNAATASSSSSSSAFTSGSRRRANAEPSYINQDFADGDKSLSNLPSTTDNWSMFNPDGSMKVTPIYPVDPTRPIFSEEDEIRGSSRTPTTQAPPAKAIASASASRDRQRERDRERERERERDRERERERQREREEPGNTSGRSTSSGMPSKRVLTIALEKAQKAVEYDQAEDADRAIEAYSESVILLEQVMARVNESAGSWRQREAERARIERERRRERSRVARAERRLREGGPSRPADGGNDDDGNGDGGSDSDDEPETAQEAEERARREARLIRREQLRAEECERLRVIRDTYAERVAALEEENDDRRTVVGRSSRSGLSNGVNRRRSGSSASASSSSNRPRTPPRPARASGLGARSGSGTGDGPVRRSEDSARVGIGSAMLANSPLSPTFPAGTQQRTGATSPSRGASGTPTPTESGMRTSVVPFPASPNQQKVENGRSAAGQGGSVSGSPPALSLPEIQPLTFSPASSLQGSSGVSRTRNVTQTSSPQQSMLSFSPDSETSDSAQFSQHQQHAPDAAATSASSHKKNASVASYNKALPNIEGLASFGATNNYGANASRSKGKARAVNEYEQDDDQDSPEGLATPTPDNSYSTVFVSTSPPKLAQAERSVAAAANANANVNANASVMNRPRSGSKAASAALRHMTSSESLAPTTTSASSAAGAWNSTASQQQQVPVPPLPAGPRSSGATPQTRYEPPAMPLPPDPIDARGIPIGQPRQNRSASVAAGSLGGQSSHRSSSAHAPRGDRQRSSTLLINTTTTHGTIHQRRKSPQVPDSEIFFSAEENVAEGPGGLVFRDRGSEEYNEPMQTARSLTAKHIPLNDTTSGGSNHAAASSMPFNVAGSLPMRLRALSQPSKRPGLQSYNSDFAALPPLVPPPPMHAPGMQRADSDPTAGANFNAQDLPNTPTLPATPVSIDYANSKDGVNANVPGISLPSDVQESTISPTNSHLSGMSKTAPSNITSFLEPDTPAAMMFPSPESRSMIAGMNADFQPAPTDPARRPFHFLQRIRASILSGALLTERLYVPKAVWTQASVKLVHTETKVRMLDLLLGGLEAVERTGDVLLLDGQVKAGNAGSKLDAANRLMRELESFEGMLDGVQSTLAKKLGYIEQPNGKKGGGGSFGIWSSKLSRSMDRMTKGKNLDAPETYVAAIARLCLHAQILDRHIASLHDSASALNGGTSMHRSSQDHHHLHNRASPLEPAHPSGYSSIPADRMVYIDARLKRTSEFFGKVICKMLLNDLGIWLDKYSKLSVNYMMD